MILIYAVLNSTLSMLFRALIRHCQEKESERIVSVSKQYSDEEFRSWGHT
jgi:hypothetical protein